MNGSSKILILLLLTLCSTLSVIPAAAISNGQDDDTNTFPSVGVVLYQDTDEAWWYVCSGTLIGPNLFLTAAHCTSTLAHYLTIGIINDLSDIYVSFDTPLTLPPTSSPLTFGVTAMHSHPSYNPRTGQPDVGLIILDTADTGITPRHASL